MSKRERVFRGPNGRLERVDKRAKLVLGPKLSKERKALIIDTTAQHQSFEFVVPFIAPWLTFFELLCVLSCLILNRKGFDMATSFTYWYENVLRDKKTLESIPWQIKVLPDRPQVIVTLCKYFKSLLRKLKSKLSADKDCYWPCFKCLSRPPDFHNKEADNQVAFHLCLRCVKQHYPWAIVSVHQMFEVYPLSPLTFKEFKEKARHYFKLTTSRKLHILNKKGGYITTEDANVTWKAIQDGVPFYVDNYIRYFEPHLHAKERAKFKESLTDDAARCAAFVSAQFVQFLAST